MLVHRDKEDMMNRTSGRNRVALTTGLVAICLGVFSGTALAAPNPTPNGYCGALNMVQAWGVGAQGGMENAMSRDNQNGNDGMWRAVAASSCS